MAKNDDFQETFNQLKAIFKPFAAKLLVVHDTDTNYYLDTHRLREFSSDARLCIFGVARNYFTGTKKAHAGEIVFQLQDARRKAD